DLDNACAKSRVLEALLAQAVAMQIISTLGLSCCRKRKRGTSGRWRQSAPGLCSVRFCALPMSRSPRWSVKAQVHLGKVLKHAVLHKNVAEPCARAITEFGLIPGCF